MNHQFPIYSVKLKIGSSKDYINTNINIINKEGDGNNENNILI